MRYFRNGAGSVGLDAFEAATMPAHIFREQLKMVFNIKVTLPELFALIAHFDKTGCGEVPCKAFLTEFLRLGFEEREHLRLQWRKEALEKVRENDLFIAVYAELNFWLIVSTICQLLLHIVLICCAVTIISLCLRLLPNICNGTSIYANMNYCHTVRVHVTITATSTSVSMVINLL